MRIDSASVPVTICDVSSHGLLLRSTQPPPRGTYVEVTRPGITTVARVIWTSGASFGVQTREKLDVASMTETAGNALEKTICLAPANDGRTYVSAPHRREASRWLAGRMHFVAIAVGGVVVGALGASLVFELLMSMSAAVQSGLH